jgi:hypothetical protein
LEGAEHLNRPLRCAVEQVRQAAGNKLTHTCWQSPQTLTVSFVFAIFAGGGERAAANTLSKHSPALRVPTRRATSCQKNLWVGSTWQYAACTAQHSAAQRSAAQRSEASTWSALCQPGKQATNMQRTNHFIKGGPLKGKADNRTGV